jgi:hypothetical protein
MTNANLSRLHYHKIVDDLLPSFLYQLCDYFSQLAARLTWKTN